MAKTFAEQNPSLAAVMLGALGPDYLHSSIYGTPREVYWYERLVQEVRDSLGEAAFNEEVRRGGHLAPEQALQLALDAVRAVAR